MSMAVDYDTGLIHISVESYPVKCWIPAEDLGALRLPDAPIPIMDKFIRIKRVANWQSGDKYECMLVDKLGRECLAPSQDAARAIAKHMGRVVCSAVLTHNQQYAQGLATV